MNHNVTNSPRQTCPQGQSEVSVQRVGQHSLVQISADAAVVLHHGVGGVVPGPVDVVDVHLGAARLLCQAICGQLNPVMDQTWNKDIS